MLQNKHWVPFLLFAFFMQKTISSSDFLPLVKTGTNVSLLWKWSGVATNLKKAGDICTSFEAYLMCVLHFLFSSNWTTRLTQVLDNITLRIFENIIYSIVCLLIVWNLQAFSYKVNEVWGSNVKSSDHSWEHCIV